MQSRFLDWLDSLNFGLGTLIAVIVVLTGFIIAINKAMKTYNKMIEDNAKKREENEKVIHSVGTLVESVSTLKDEIQRDRVYQAEYRSDISQKLDSLTEMLEKERELSRQGDEILKTQIGDLSSKVDIIDKKSNLLIESDKEGIKGNITDKYYIAIEEGYIQVHTLETLEAQYDKYLEENGNTFVAGLMESLRSLPHTKPVKKATVTKTRKKTTNENT